MDHGSLTSSICIRMLAHLLHLSFWYYNSLYLDTLDTNCLREVISQAIHFPYGEEIRQKFT